MSFTDSDPKFVQRVLVMKMIVVSLGVGVALFLGVALFARLGGAFQAVPDVPVLTYVACLNGVMMIVARLILPSMIASSSRRKIARGEETLGASRPATVPGDAGKLLEIFQVQLIVGTALLDAAAFLFLIGYILEGQVVDVAGAIVFLLGILWQFPSVDGVERWIEEQRELLEQERVEP